MIGGQIGRDLRDGTWDRRNGELLDFADYDVGMRLIVAQ